MKFHSRTRVICLSILSALLFYVLSPATSAQEKTGIEERLAKAVQAGEISPDEMKLMLHVLRESQTKKDAKKQIGNERFQQAAAEIKAAVQAGSITKQQASEKLTALRRSFAGSNQAQQKSNKAEAYRKQYAEIEQAVKEGKLSKEDARAKLMAIKRAAIESSGQKKLAGKSPSGHKHPEKKAPVKKALEKKALEKKAPEKKAPEKKGTEEV